MTFGYPVVLDLTDVPVLVVGAGPIGARKVAGLAAAGAAGAGRRRPRVRRPRPRRWWPSCAQRAYRARRPRRRPPRRHRHRRRRPSTPRWRPTPGPAGLWVNAADQPADCTFILPAVARNGPLSVAVSTDGTSPALARRLRDHAAALLDDDVVALARELAERRREVRAAGGSTEDVDWSSLIDPVLPPVGRRDADPTAARPRSG